MQKQNHGGVKVTYIETQYVTSDAAGFKSLVQRLTGNSAEAEAEAGRPVHRPRPSRPAAEGRNAVTAAATTGSGSYYSSAMPATAGSVGAAAGGVRAAGAGAGVGQQPCVDELCGLWDYSELFCAGERRHGEGYYSDFLY